MAVVFLIFLNWDVFPVVLLSDSSNATVNSLCLLHFVKIIYIKRFHIVLRYKSFSSILWPPNTMRKNSIKMQRFHFV